MNLPFLSCRAEEHNAGRSSSVPSRIDLCTRASPRNSISSVMNISERRGPAICISCTLYEEPPSIKFLLYTCHIQFVRYRVYSYRYLNCAVAFRGYKYNSEDKSCCV